ncbi:MAG TPA: sugar ABC transporter permease [Ktedonobacterales bacterium]|jgi:alpha-glucoside transport system permease protein
MASSVESVTPSTRERASELWRRWGPSLGPWIWAGPTIIILAILLVWPVLRTIWMSFLNDTSTSFVGLRNYVRIFSNSSTLEILRNNVLWLILGTVATVILGLVIAVLADRARFERFNKAAIFIPMAISMVGAAVIWKFVYQYAPAGQTQVGLLNAVITHFGLPPQAWLVNAGVNNLALIAAYVWMWTGFCMVILSAALKSIPDDVLEAARVDGANEFQIFLRVIVPLMSPTIAVVATTMIINILKIFDIVYVMSGGDFGTNVIAVAFYQEFFNFSDFGLGSALAVILLIVIIPVMLININRFRAQEAQR